MMCYGCGGDTLQNVWGNWCDDCGGVMIEGTPVFEDGIITGKKPPRLFFRHVATVYGKGAVYPIIYDLSSESYGVCWRKKVINVKCKHCGEMTPAETRGNVLLDDTSFVSQGDYLSRRGDLDAIVALIQPIAAEETGDIPMLSISAHATDQERKLLEV